MYGYTTNVVAKTLNFYWLKATISGFYVTIK